MMPDCGEFGKQHPKSNLSDRLAAESAPLPPSPCDAMPLDPHLQASCRDAAMMAVREDLRGAREVSGVNLRWRPSPPLQITNVIFFSLPDVPSANNSTHLAALYLSTGCGHPSYARIIFFRQQRDPYPPSPLFVSACGSRPGPLFQVRPEHLRKALEGRLAGRLRTRRFTFSIGQGPSGAA